MINLIISLIVEFAIGVFLIALPFRDPLLAIRIYGVVFGTSVLLSAIRHTANLIRAMTEAPEE